MPSSFWQTQMDCVFFVYGLSFILLAVIVFGKNHSLKNRLPWNFLAWFGILHGINEWFDMLAIDLGDPFIFKCFRLVLMAVSFVPLVEFGRRGLEIQHFRVPGRWIHLLFIALGFTGYFSGINGLNATLRYALGFSGAILACCVCVQESFHVKHEKRWPLRLIAGVFLIYGLATGLVVPPAGFFPANVFNYDTFMTFTGFPIQLVRAFCATVAAVGVWLVFRNRGIEKIGVNCKMKCDKLGK